MTESIGKPFRVIDTGVRDGRRQIAFDQALIDAHKAGAVPDSIRFLAFPPTALIGRHQALSREVRLAHCRANGIGVVRRITGGGALYCDEGQLGWELVFHRTTLPIGTLGDLAREICEAAAAGLRTLGVDARYRPRNDIEVDGRKISGTGGFFDEDTLFYQGTLLIDTDASRMVAALNIPQAKLAKRALDSAAHRVVTLKELLGAAPPIDAVKEALLDGFRRHLGIVPVAGEITAHEEALATRYHDEEIGTEAFVTEIDDPQPTA
ncbi:MAG: lipoate--protein ligase family protein, partial [Burkholderiales bacterium]|nr:lipoate--protein ligase family protein [Burkholderiales bacterium]